MAVIIFVARLLASHIYDPTIYHGQWYTVHIPPGWSKKVEEDEVFFESEKKDFIGNPLAIISVYGYQSRGALFMDLFFPDVLKSLSEQNGKILQQGQEKIDGVVAGWVLFKYYDPKWILYTFYAIDENNRLTKIQLMTKPDYFNEYRPVFKQFRDEMKIKKFGNF